MKSMGFCAIILATAFALTSCGNAEASKSNNTADSSATAIPFTNGVTDANKGMKKGEIQLKGQFQTPVGKVIYLYSVYGRTYDKIDSAAVVNNVFDFGKKSYDQGLYMIGTNENNVVAVILNPSEPVVELGFKTARMDMGFYAIQSKENDGWSKYMPQETAMLKAIKDLKVAAAKSSIKGEMEKQVLAKEIEFAKLQGKFIADYPNTHLAKMLTWKQEPVRNDIQKYWDNIDFTDHSIMHSNILGDRIQSFMRSFSKGEESGFINCIQIVADKAKADDTILEFALNQMLVGFYESGMENISTYLIDNFVNGDSCGDADLSNVIKSTAESIQRLSVGATPPNIQMTGNTGQQVDLMKLAAANKYTLVLFWSSWCEHCKGEAPEVKMCYDQWHAKGFEIVGVSVDTQKALWEAAIKERGFTFPNVCGMKQWDSKVAKDYRVTKTPAFFLLDNTGKIVMKPKAIREVQAYLQKNIH